MLQITPHMKIFIALGSTDFRCGIDGLAASCKSLYKEDPKSGALFVFCNRGSTAIKILVYDSTGFWLCHKRLSKGKFSWWPKSGIHPEISKLGARELMVLLWNGDPSGVFRDPWRRIGPEREEEGKKEYSS